MDEEELTKKLQDTVRYYASTILSDSEFITPNRRVAAAKCPCSELKTLVGEDKP